MFNRMTPGADIMPFHKIARAVNRKIDIMYEYTDGTSQFDEIVDPLPFDINASVIEIKDEDYALFYRDITEEPKKYDGKTAVSDTHLQRDGQAVAAAEHALEAGEIGAFELVRAKQRL